MDGHPGRRIVGGASAGPDADHLAGDHDRRARFREQGRGFPWAWDEEVAAGEAHLPERQSARLAAACQVAADALAEEVLRRDVLTVAGPARGLSGVSDAKVVVAQGAARQEQRVPQAQLGVPPQARVLLREPGQRVSPQEPQAREPQPERVLRAQASPPQVQEHGRPVEQLNAQGQQASRPLADAPAMLGEQQEPPGARDGAQPLSPLLLSRHVRLPRRFRRSLHLAGDA